LFSFAESSLLSILHPLTVEFIKTGDKVLDILFVFTFKFVCLTPLMDQEPGERHRAGRVIFSAGGYLVVGDQV